MDLPETFRHSFMHEAQVGSHHAGLKSACLTGPLNQWTTALTACVVTTCREIGLRASAKGYECELLPVRRSEYLALDVMAFAAGDRRWLFPTAVMELENSQEVDKIAYSLWKVLSVRAGLRIVFCYRKDASAAPALIQHLRHEVTDAMGLRGRLNLDGRTFVVVGSRNDADTFPFGFFKWWELNTHTGRFEQF